LPSIYKVINTADSGAGSLRQEILDANKDQGSTIQFSIGTGQQVIQPLSALPAIRVTTTLDGTMQTGYNGSPLIELDGTAAGPGVDGLDLESGNVTVKGLVISGFSGNGIHIASSGDLIAGNYIGTDFTGLVPLPNALSGIFINNGPGNTIGGTTAAARNVIAGNGTATGVSAGVLISGSKASGNVVEGNYIGVGADGKTPVSNAQAGVHVGNAAANTSIGGTAAGAGNVIAANGADGVVVDDVDGSTGKSSGVAGNGTVIAGNLIGLNAAGTAAVANAGNGVQLRLGASNNVIGGTASGAGNVISGNTLDGVHIEGSGAKGNQVQGNLIGLNMAGTAAVANAGNGVALRFGANNNGIGAAAAGNVISGNTLDGVSIADQGTTANTLLANSIGLASSGTQVVPNGGDGVALSGGASGNTVGAGNVISGNLLAGVFITDNASSGNTVQGSFIGTTPSGLAGLGNTQRGILIDGAPNNTVGGITAPARNVISGNGSGGGFAGITIENPGARNNLVAGNYIGVGPDGTTVLPNTGAGVHVGNAANNNTVGGSAAGAGNVITGNLGPGVRVNDADSDTGTLTGNAGADNEIRRNAIYGNQPTGPQIDLSDGGNHGQAAPVLASAITSGGQTTVMGSLTGAPTTAFTLEFFASTVGTPPQGQTFLTQLTETTDGTGTVNFTAPLTVTAPAGQFLTATATSTPTLDTSELSAAVVVDQVPAFTSAAGAAFTMNVAGTFPVTASGFSAPTFSLTGAPAWLSIGNTTGVLAGTPPDLGTGPFSFTFTITATNGFQPDGTQSFTLTVRHPPAMAANGAATFTAGTAGSATVTATGDPAPTFSLTGAPAWLKIDANSGVLTGTPPLGPGPYTFPFTITAGNGLLPNATESFTLTVDQAPAITSAASATFIAGTQGSVSVTATGSPTPVLSEAAGDTLPSNVTFDPATGLLSGKPAAGSGGSYTLHFTAHNGVGSDATQTFTLTVNEAPRFSSAAGGTFTEDAAGRFRVAASGFPAPTLSEADALPAGLSFDPNTGVLSGVPAEGTAGTYTLHFTAHNGIGADASLTFTLTINPVPVQPPSQPPPPPVPRGITARLVTVKAGKKKKRLVIDVFYADTGEKKAELPSPYQSPAGKNIQVSVRSSTGLGVPDEVVVTARKGKKNVSTTFGA
jgi:hypothetical protein